MLLDVGPDRGGPLRVVVLVLAVGARRGHVLDRHDHAQVPPLLGRGRHDLDGLGATEITSHLLQGPHGRGEADPLRRLLQQGVEALQGQRQVGATLGRRDRVDLVDDHCLDAAQRLAGLAGQHQEQRLGGGDQDVGRSGRQAPPIGRGRVARPNPDPHLGRLDTQPFGGLPDPHQRAAQVALDVHAQRLERGDVEDPAAFRLRWHRLGQQLVDRPQERAQRLARSGGRHHQRVAPRPDRLPGTGLSRGRGREGSLEPRTCRVAEPRQRLGRIAEAEPEAVWVAHGTNLVAPTDIRTPH